MVQSRQIDWDNLPDHQDVGRWRLLASGRRLLVDEGLGALTVAAIAAGAKMAKPSFYTYFPSREEFLDDLRSALSADATAHAHRAAEGPWEGIFTRMVLATVEWMMEQPRVGPLFSAGYMADPDRTSRTNLVEMLRDVIGQGMEAGIYRPLEGKAGAGKGGKAGDALEDDALEDVVAPTFDVLSGATTLAAYQHPDERAALTAQAFLDRALGFDPKAARGAAYTRPSGG